MLRTLSGAMLGILLAAGAPRAWRLVAARSNTQVHQVNS
ncbi:hypothetical protein G419_26039 [Rhodococcus triatomae BKS 15-14]|nr:hypothetical protein G419_26039 [Rhodococcus triatomae BKS 15-14]